MFDRYSFSIFLLVLFLGFLSSKLQVPPKATASINPDVILVRLITESWSTLHVMRLLDEARKNGVQERDIDTALLAVVISGDCCAMLDIILKENPSNIEQALDYAVTAGRFTIAQKILVYRTEHKIKEISYPRL